MRDEPLREFQHHVDIERFQYRHGSARCPRPTHRALIGGQKHDRRRVVVFLQPLEYFPTGEPRQRDIKEDEVGSNFRVAIKSLESVNCRTNLVPGANQQCVKQATNGGIILDDENAV